MAIQGTVTKPTFAALEIGLYHARLDKIEEIKKKEEWIKDENDDPWQWQWDFTILDGKHAGRSLRAYTSRFLSSGSKAGKWISNWTGVEMAEGLNVVLDDLLTFECGLMVDKKKNSKGEDTNVVVSVTSWPGAPVPVLNGNGAMQATMQEPQVTVDFNGTGRNGKAATTVPHPAAYAQQKPEPSLEQELEADVPAANEWVNRFNAAMQKMDVKGDDVLDLIQQACGVRKPFAELTLPKQMKVTRQVEEWASAEDLPF